MKDCSQILHLFRNLFTKFETCYLISLMAIDRYVICHSAKETMTACFYHKYM